MNTYKNPNLIYVGGRGYREQDLIDMIQYYQKTYQPNIVVLPKNWNEDASSQIFKHYSFYPHISKSTYRPELYYEQNCDLNITFKEFIDYINENEPYECAFLTITKDKKTFIINIIYISKTLSENYNLSSFTLNNYGDSSLSEFTDTFDNILEFMIGNKYDIIWYDFKTVKEIYKNRSRCQEYNKDYDHIMHNKYIDQYLSGIPKIVNKDTFITYYSYYLFLLYNMMIIKQNPAIQEDIIDFIELILIDQDIPNNVDELKYIMEPYIIENVL
jgi:hypothetical protein